jgi:hypothetical protein
VGTRFAEAHEFGRASARRVSHGESLAFHEGIADIGGPAPDAIGKRMKFGHYGSPSTNARNSRSTSASVDRNM